MSKKIKKIQKKDTGWSPEMAWRAQVLFLLLETSKDGVREPISVRDLRRVLSCHLGTLNKLVTEFSLDTIRSREDVRTSTLVALHQQRPPKHEAFIEREMERLVMSWKNATALNVFRRDRDKPVEQNIAERVFVPRTGKGRRGDEANVNEAADALSWLLAKGKIEQWQYDAGTAWRADIEAAQSFRGQEVGKDAVQGGLMAGTISDSQAMAIDRLAEVQAALCLIWPHALKMEPYRITKLACLSMSARVADKLDEFMLLWIRRVLEPIAWVYGIAPSGDVSTRLSSATANGRLRKRGEIE